MNQEHKNRLMLQETSGERASEVLTFLEDWLQAYHEWIISNLKTCSEDRLRDLRNLLVASEDFKGFLERAVVDGKLASNDLQEIAEREAYEAERGF